jgi:hypothetical protein
MILDGTSDPIAYFDLVGNSVGVSMTEAMWLSIRSRAQAAGISTSAALLLIVSGAKGCISPRDLVIGRLEAKRREEKREKKDRMNPAPKAKEKPKKKRQRKKASRKPADLKLVPEVIPDIPTPDVVVETAPDIPTPDVVVDLPTDSQKAEPVKNVNLSKGEPVGSEPKEGQKEIIPDDDYYGGVFSF